MYIGDLAYVRKARGLKGFSLSTGDGLPPLPAGFVFITRADGTYLKRADGAYFVRAA